MADLGASVRASDEPAAYPRTDGVDDDDHAHDHQQQHGDLVPAAELQALDEGQADAARAYHAQHGGGAQVDLEAVEHVRGELGQHLRHHRVEERLQLVAARGADGLHGALIDALHHVGEDLAQVADGVDAHGHDARGGARAGGGHEDDGEHQLREGAYGHQHGLARQRPAGAAQEVAGGEEREREGQQRAQGGAEDGHEERLDHGAPRQTEDLGFRVHEPAHERHEVALEAREEPAPGRQVHGDQGHHEQHHHEHGADHQERAVAPDARGRLG